MDSDLGLELLQHLVLQHVRSHLQQREVHCTLKTCVTVRTTPGESQPEAEVKSLSVSGKETVRYQMVEQARSPPGRGQPTRCCPRLCVSIQMERIQANPCAVVRLSGSADTSTGKAVP